MRTRRIGKFRVAGMFLQPDNDCAKRLFAKVIVMDVVRHWELDAVDYIGYSDEFDPIPEGERASVYDVICSGDPIVVSFRRSLNGEGSR